jgi:hypothetical protein
MVNAMARTCAVLFVLFTMACAGDDETPKSRFSEPCTMDLDCAEGLECKLGLGICSQSCSTMQECRARLGSETAICESGACQEPCTMGGYMRCAQYGVDCVTTFAGSTCRQP